MHSLSSIGWGGLPGAAASHRLPRRFPPVRHDRRRVSLGCSRDEEVPASVKQRLEYAAASGEGLSAEEVRELLNVAKEDKKKAKKPSGGSAEDADQKRFIKFPEGLNTKDIEIPERAKNILKDLKVWDLIPPEGMRAGLQPDDDVDKNLSGIWTKQEYEILTDEDYEGTEEEMARREVIKYMAIEKLASALTAHHTDPEKIFNYGLRTKSGLKVNKFINYKYAIEELWKKFGRQVLEDDEFYIDMSDYNDSRDHVREEFDPDIEKYLGLLAQGKQLPHPSTWNNNLLPPEDADTFEKRLQVFLDFQHDIKAKRQDRRLSEEEFKAIKQRRKEFDRDFDKVHDDVFPEEINVSQIAPMWPEWQEKYHRCAEHMYYLLRSCHIDGTTTEPPRRLKKYNLIADDVQFSVSNVLHTTGYEEYINHMFKLRSAGVRTEGSNLFLTVSQPKGERSEDNPNDYEIVCDFFCYVPIPEGYQEMVKEQDRQMEERRKQAPLGIAWQNPLDISDYAEAWMNQTNTMLLQYMDEQVKSPAAPPPAASPAATWEIGDEDPYPDEGPFWQPDEACGGEWKTGKVFSINSTMKYFVDVKAGKINRIEVGWGGMIGSINTMEDGEKMYRLAAGLDPTVTTGDYRSFQSLVYDAFFKNPVDWVKETILKPMAERKAKKGSL